MIRILENQDLSTFNTFGIKARTDLMVISNEMEEMGAWLRDRKPDMPVLILGQGSNVLFADDFRGVILHYTGDRLEITGEDSDSIRLKVGAGMVWDRLVEHCVNQGFYGIENLSLIPGFTGSAPVQNIGAYGVEVREVIEEVSGIDLDVLQLKKFTNRECRFGYRNSIFKEKLRNRFLITEVVFALRKKGVLNTCYGTVREELSGLGGASLESMRQAIINIRSKKLPDPAELGNAGSFFKNPVVEKEYARQLLSKYPTMPTYPAEEDRTKVAAGWLIEQCGWKGRRMGDAGVHHLQSLVLVNHGRATGQEILALALEIQHSVNECFGIWLEPEVTVIG